MMQTLTETCILIGAASLIYWARVFGEEGLVPWRAELPFALALLTGGVAWVGRFLRGRVTPRANRDIVVAALALAVFLAFTVIATMISLLRYHLWFDSLGLRNLAKLVLGFLLFLVTAHFLRGRPVFYRRLALALFIPPLLPLAAVVLFLTAPGMYQSLSDHLGLSGIVSPGDRFSGFTSNPAQAAYNALIAAAFLVVAAVVSQERRQYGRAALAWLLVIGMSILILWSQTRTAILALGAVVVVGIFASGTYLRLRPPKPALYIGAALLAVSLGLFFLPADAKELLGTRVTLDAIFGGEGRRDVLLYYLDLVPTNPLGLGLNFEQEFVVDLPFEERQNAHSLLDLWVFGGIGGMLAVGLMLAVVGLRFVRVLRTQAPSSGRGFVVYYLGAFTAFVGIWVAGSLTGSPLNDLYHPLLLAMVLTGPVALDAARDGR